MGVRGEGFSLCLVCRKCRAIASATLSRVESLIVQNVKQFSRGSCIFVVLDGVFTVLQERNKKLMLEQAQVNGDDEHMFVRLVTLTRQRHIHVHVHVLSF